MGSIIQPLVVKSQQLIVGCNQHMIYRMSDSEKVLFSKRLKELCDEKNLPEHGRQTILKKKFRVSQEAVRKWLDGESIPRHHHKVDLCDYFGVSFEWLSTGKGIKYQENESIFGIDETKLTLKQKEIMKKISLMNDEELTMAEDVFKIVGKKEKSENE